MASGNGNQIIVQGLLPGGKVPGARWLINVAQGRVDPSAIPRYLLLIANKTSGGSALADAEVREIFPSTDVPGLFGARSEMAQMVRMARKVPGLRIKAIACAEAAGGTAATLTITFVGTTSSSGTFHWYMAGKTINCTVPAGTAQNAVATAVQQAFAADPDIPVTASVAANVVTLTVANLGARGNDWVIYFDPADKPGTTTVALAGGGATNPAPGGVVGAKFAGGAGVDDLTNVLATLQGEQYFTIAAAHNDVGTNVPLLKAYNAAKANLGTQIYEHIVLGHTGSYANAQTLAKTTLNKHRFQVGWMRGAEAHPCMVAASLGAVRTQLEQQHPNRRFNGMALPGLPGQRAAIDRPSDGETGEQQTAMDNGVTPLTSSAQGDSLIVRSITTLCVVDGVPNYNCIDSGQARTPDVAAELLSLAWTTEYGKNNEYVNRDPRDGEDAPAEGVATPRFWASYAQLLLSKKIAQNWFSSVSVAAEYDSVNRMLLTSINLEIAPLNHRIGGNINQVVPA